MSDLVSDCHTAKMKVVGDSFGEGTNHYECLECGEPCNWVEPANADEQDEVDGWILKAEQDILTHLKQAELHGRIKELDDLPPYMFDAFPSVKERLEELKSMKGEV